MAAYKLKEHMKGQRGSPEKSARALCYLSKLGTRAGSPDSRADQAGRYADANAFDLPGSLLVGGEKPFEAIGDFFEAA